MTLLNFSPLERQMPPGPPIQTAPRASRKIAVAERTSFGCTCWSAPSSFQIPPLPELLAPLSEAIQTDAIVAGREARSGGAPMLAGKRLMLVWRNRSTPPAVAVQTLPSRSSRIVLTISPDRPLSTANASTAREFTLRLRRKPCLVANQTLASRSITTVASARRADVGGCPTRAWLTERACARFIRVPHATVW